jgi:hypothetical protein
VVTAVGLHVPHRLPTQFELLVSAHVVCSVETAEHQRSWSIGLPSADRPHGFSAQVVATRHVTDPAEAVRSRSGPGDPADVCATYLDARLRLAAE